jgi:lipopolysaccharide/colanic/teichoic acid biosynthesis glycosyltransferase
MSENGRASVLSKRAIDIGGTLFGLILCAPLMLLIAIYIKISAGSPIFYHESRIGLNQKPFRLYKFRSMRPNKGHQGASVASGDDLRILPFGHFLRNSHLDELPQLWNVLRGDMSLVGPRPYKPAHFARLPEASRHIIASIKPGLSGVDALLFIAEDEALKGLQNPEAVYLDYFLPEKAKQQIEYIQTQSLRTDLRLILQTLCALFSRRTRQNSIRYLRRLYEDKGKPKQFDALSNKPPENLVTKK